MSDYQLVKYSVGKKNYEIAVKPTKVPLYRKQKITSLDDVLLSFDVYRDFSKGEVCSTSDLSEFELDSKEKVLKKILMDGDYQLSTQERRELTEKKKREIITYIHKYYIDPKSNLPHPPDRIEGVLDKIHFNIDYKQSAESQVKLIVQKMLGQLSLRKTVMDCDFEISHELFGKSSGIIQKYCKILTQKFTVDGVKLHVEIIPGDFDVFIKQLNDITKGDFKFQITGANASTDEPKQDDSKKGKKGGNLKKKQKK